MAPWHLKPCLVDTSLTGNGRKDENPLLLKNKAIATIDTYSDTVNIYTDASKTLENKTAAAYCVPTVNVKHCARLQQHYHICSRAHSSKTSRTLGHKYSARKCHYIQ